MFYLFKVVALFFILSFSVYSHSTKKKSLDTHIHGISTLNIAQDENILSFEFEMPGNDIVGFEYRATEEADINKVKNAINILSNHKNMVVPSGSGKCKIQSISSNVINEGKHSEFISNYKFHCKNIKGLKVIYINYFKNFDNGKKLNIKVYGKNKKSVYVINKSKKIINVKNYF